MADSKKWSEMLTYKKKSFYERRESADFDKAIAYAKGYAAYLDASKTEREAVKESIRLAEQKGFRPYHFGDKMEPGDKFYYNNRDKNLYLFSIGTESVEKGVRICAAHIDSPRLDLKQCPLYEEDGMSFFKTHYYGGIRKYQWVATPLALHGVVVKTDGTRVDVCIGEDDSDPVFYINDLLPHLSHHMDNKPISEAITGEKLNILVGSKPFNGAEFASALFERDDV